ncbi:hypothetical protein Tco_0860249 [Tanacetum coccineum]|uniref:Uncharacterized protein n=1 Tax=Tanacetum coccineum TaxID=301880 RepID=A0ABQ5BHD7_9ASTR
MNNTEPPPLPLRSKGPELGADNLTLEGVATELAPSDFVSQNYETLVALIKRKQKRDQARAPVPDKNFGPEDKYLATAPTKRKSAKGYRHLYNCHQRPLMSWHFAMSTQHGQRCSPSERSLQVRTLRQRASASRRRISSSSENSSDNEDAETGHWKSKNKYRADEDEDMSRIWRRQKVDAFTRRISDFSEDKRRRMPANLKTYDGASADILYEHCFQRQLP